jgi:hypothetical protein
MDLASSLGRRNGAMVQTPPEKEILIDGQGGYAAGQDHQMRVVNWQARKHLAHDKGWWVAPSWDGRHLAF